MEKDPVCGMSVEPLRAAAQEEHDGKNYFFCSGGCATKFRTEPAKYLSQPAAIWERPALWTQAKMTFCILFPLVVRSG